MMRSKNWHLTVREEEFIGLVADVGMTVNQAAQYMGLANRSGPVYLHRVMKKIGAPSALHAVLAWDRERRGVELQHPSPDSLLRDFNTCSTCRGLGFVRKDGRQYVLLGERS